MAATASPAPVAVAVGAATVAAAAGAVTATAIATAVTRAEWRRGAEASEQEAAPRAAVVTLFEPGRRPRSEQETPGLPRGLLPVPNACGRATSRRAGWSVPGSGRGGGKGHDRMSSTLRGV